MNDQHEAVEYKLDSLTKSVRFAAGIAPKCATRVSLGVALALEDAAVDPAGELLGIKLQQGASALASGCGSIASAVRDGVSSGARRLSSEAGPLAKVPALENARGFVTQAVSEVRGSWASAGHIAIQVEEPQPAEPASLPASPDGSELVTSIPAIEEMNS